MTYPAIYPHNTDSSTEKDPIGLVFTILTLGWIYVTSLAIHLGAWFVEQITLIQNVTWPIWVWPVIALSHAGLLLVPLVPLAWFWRGRRYRAAFRTWAATALFVLFLIPVRFAQYNQEQLAAVLRIAGTLLYVAVISALIWLRRRGSELALARPRGPYLPGLLLAAFLTYAWLAWGALGSAIEILLNLTSAALFGLAFGLLIGRFLLEDLQRTGSGSGRNVILGGAISSASLLIMSSALGSQGLQIVLMLTMPVLGWTLMALSRWGRKDAPAGWLTISLLLSLAAAAPMLFVDPDELLLVLNLGSRDIMAWTLYAVLATVLAGWILALVLFLVRDRLPSWHSRRSLALGIAAVWLAGALLYALAGQPGLYGDGLFVILKEQADVSTAGAIDDYVERREHVYEMMVAHAKATQQPIRASLDRLGVKYTPYYLVNAIEVDGGPLLGLWLRARPEIDRVLHNPVLRPLPAPVPTSQGMAPPPTLPQWNLTSIGADRVWSELGVTGKGIIVGQSDSGVQGDHPELRDAYRGKDGIHDYNWLDPWNHTTAPTDIGGHGTHTLGTILGSSVGVAPDAEWYGCVNLARNLGNPARYLDCMQFMLAPFPSSGDPMIDGEPSLGAHVINNSWGCPPLEGCDPGALVQAVRALRAAGVFVVASAGNEGDGCSSVGSPLALYDEAFTVGAVDATGAIALFSSRGPVTADGSRRTKPDIVAPGVDVLSAYPHSTYYRADGTSMAGPHVVGVVALMWSANPALIGDIDRTEQILIETARPYDYSGHGPPHCGEQQTYPNNAVGYGLVDAYAAVQQTMREQGQP